MGRLNKCAGMGCPLRDSCERYVSEGYQFMLATPYNAEENKCAFFVKIYEEEEKEKSNTESN